MGYTDTPSKLTPEILAFCRELVDDATPVYVPVQPLANAEQQNCFPVVEKQVFEAGGELVYGWQIWEWPEVYLEAEFHAVWGSPDGTLLDLTPKDIPTKRILFLPDRARTYTGRQVKNEMRALNYHPAVGEFIRACDERFSFLDHRLGADGRAELGPDEIGEWIAINQRQMKACTKLEQVSRTKSVRLN